jgi:hypothetical protein
MGFSAPTPWAQPGAQGWGISVISSGEIQKSRAGAASSSSTDDIPKSGAFNKVIQR